MGFVRIAAVVVICFFSVGSRAQTKDETNRKIVGEFYDLVFNQHKPDEAVKKYVGENYIQHNPFVADGKQPFAAFFKVFFKKNPQSRSEIKRMIAQDDLVVLHVHSKIEPNETGKAVVDIFRLENGKIVEHWDVAQPVPDKSANSNSMF